MPGYVEFIDMLFAIHLGFHLEFHKHKTSLKPIQTLQLLGKKTGRGEHFSSPATGSRLLSGR